MYILVISIVSILLLLYYSVYPTLLEGASFQPYDTSDPLILAQQNAGNIQVLYDKVSKLDALSDKIASLSTSVDTNTESINSIVDSQQAVTDQLQDSQDEFS
jgi:hypothetical protein